MQSILNLEPCKRAYWLLTVSQVPLAFLLTGFSAWHLHHTTTKHDSPELQVTGTRRAFHRSKYYKAILQNFSLCNFQFLMGVFLSVNAARGVGLDWPKGVRCLSEHGRAGRILRRHVRNRRGHDHQSPPHRNRNASSGIYCYIPEHLLSTSVVALCTYCHFLL